MNECVSAELIWKMFARIDGGMKVAKQKEIYVFSLLCKSTKKKAGIPTQNFDKPFPTQNTNSDV